MKQGMKILSVFVLAVLLGVGAVATRPIPAYAVCSGGTCGRFLDITCAPWTECWLDEDCDPLPRCRTVVSYSMTIPSCTNTCIVSWACASGCTPL